MTHRLRLQSICQSFSCNVYTHFLILWCNFSWCNISSRNYGRHFWIIKIKNLFRASLKMKIFWPHLVQFACNHIPTTFTFLMGKFYDLFVLKFPWKNRIWKIHRSVNYASEYGVKKKLFIFFDWKKNKNYYTNIFSYLFLLL